MEQFMAARVNPTGELPEPTQPMEANPVLNAKDGFEMDEADHAILANHGTQLVGHFLVDADGIVRWVQIEALDGPNQPLHLSDCGADLAARSLVADREQPSRPLNAKVSTGTATRPANRDRPRRFAHTSSALKKVGLGAGVVALVEEHGRHAFDSRETAAAGSPISSASASASS